MQHNRVGTSLCEVLLALALLSATAAWGLQATAAAERTLGDTQRQRAALHRAERALADVDALPCDSVSVARTIIEPRWRLSIARTRAGQNASNDVTLRTAVGDSVQLHRSGWCD